MEAFHLQRLLMTLEHSTSRFGLLEVLDRCESSDYDQRHHLLSRWSASSEKVVLDEIEQRLALINELRQRVAKVGVDELKTTDVAIGGKDAHAGRDADAGPSPASPPCA
ncbi:hypothetical protein PV762_13745 [Mitsuaria sp. CC2]|uniref:hypothetical protein n=1 Tax=Mitsuaria sp. CC2 TaxID=3029186 RepID=UPI003B8E7F42